MSFFVQAHKFLCSRDGKSLFIKACDFLLEIEKIWVSRNFDTSNHRWGAVFNRKFPQYIVFFGVWGSYGVMRAPSATPLKSTALWGSCCLKHHLLFLLLKIVDFIKTLKKLAPQMKIELFLAHRQKFRSKFQPEIVSNNISINV